MTGANVEIKPAESGRSAKSFGFGDWSGSKWEPKGPRNNPALS